MSPLDPEVEEQDIIDAFKAELDIEVKEVKLKRLDNKKKAEGDAAAAAEAAKDGEDAEAKKEDAAEEEAAEEAVAEKTDAPAEEASEEVAGKKTFLCRCSVCFGNQLSSFFFCAAFQGGF